MGKPIVKIELDPKIAISGIAASPKSEKVGAFFDLDGTLIEGFSANHMFGARSGGIHMGAGNLLRALSIYMREGINEDSFAKLADLGASEIRGERLEDLEKVGRKIFEEKTSKYVYPVMRDIVRAHQERGHTVALCSSAPSLQVEPVAQHLGITHVLCNRFKAEDGVLTGEMERPIVWGAGKARAVQAFAAARHIDLNMSYFYADGDEEQTLMHLVGHPRPTNPGRRLTEVAERRGWPSLLVAAGQSRNRG